jgi:hypothetical protein
MRVLEKVRTHDGGHIHMLTPSNRGKELSEATPFGEPAVGEVVISYA